MPNKSIHQLPLATTREDGDLLYMVRNTTDYSLPSSALAPQVFRAIVQILSADVLTLFTTPVAVTPAIPSGKIALPLRVFLRFEAGGTVDYATNTQLILGSQSLLPGTGAMLQVDISDRSATPLILGTTGFYQAQPGEALAVSVDTGNPTAGDSNIVIETYYQLFDA